MAKSDKTKQAAKTRKTVNPRAYSSVVVDGKDRAASRAMLRPVGFTDADFKKPQIGIASTWSMVTPCNMHINTLADEACKGVDGAGGKGVIFNTITISDGISMGTENMKYSLVSREVIADSIETVMACQGYDGVVAVGGCDKNMPGCLMAIARLNRPAVFVYGGTILPGEHNGKQLDVVSVFEAIGAEANNKIPLKELKAIESKAIPGPGSCGGMYTANTMASAIEAMGDKITSKQIAKDAGVNVIRAAVKNRCCWRCYKRWPCNVFVTCSISFVALLPSLCKYMYMHRVHPCMYIWISFI